jgi:hypothetical protein
MVKNVQTSRLTSFVLKFMFLSLNNYVVGFDEIEILQFLFVVRISVCSSVNLNCASMPLTLSTHSSILILSSSKNKNRIKGKAIAI